MSTSTGNTAGASNPALQPVFLGGAGFSGANLLAEVLGRHPDLAVMQPAEFAAFTEPDGLVDAVRFGEALSRNRDRGSWWRRLLRMAPPAPQPAVGEELTPPQGAAEALRKAREQVADTGLGLDQMPESEFEEALQRYLDDFWDSPIVASRHLGATIGAAASKSDARRWVDASRLSCLRAKTLCRIFPQAKIVHVLRDGRDVAVELLLSGALPGYPQVQGWDQDGYLCAMTEWHRRAAAAQAGLLRAPSTSVLSLDIETVTGFPEQDAGYERLRRFLDVADDEQMREFCRRRIRPEVLGAGRWRDVVPAGFHAEVNRHYDGLSRSITGLGWQQS